MNISYNWLKEYVDFDLTPEEVAAALTSIGLWKKFKPLKVAWKVSLLARC
jgi:hypothetical protein